MESDPGAFDLGELKHLARALPGLTYVVQLFPTYQFLHLSGTLMKHTASPNGVLGSGHRETVMGNLIYRDDMPIFRNKIKKLSREYPTQLHTVEYRVNTSDSALFWVQDQFVGIWDEDGILVGMEGYISEIPASTMSSQLLSHLRAYRDAINVNSISSMTDAKGIITFVNKNFCEVSQYPEAELLNRNHNIIASGHHPRSFFRELWRTISSGKVWHGEIRNKAKDGSLYWVDTVIIPIYDEHRHIVNYLSLHTLITDRKNSEHNTDRHISMLENIAHTVTHGFRAPVCSILGLTGIIAQPEIYSNKEYLDQAMEHLRSAAGELDKFTRELSLKLEQIESELRNTPPRHGSDPRR